MSGNKWKGWHESEGALLDNAAYHGEYLLVRIGSLAFAYNGERLVMLHLKGK